MFEGKICSLGKSFTMTEQGQPAPFPPHLLNESGASRLDYFKAYTVAHPALKQADQAVWNALREPAGAALIFVVGPTGVGKTTLLAHIAHIPQFQQKERDFL